MEAKKTKHCDRDRLMELPEAILHHIFSYLPMKDVIKTSVLAKRLKYVWLYVPCLNFPLTGKTVERELAFINRSLLLHKALEIHKLSISLGMNDSHEVDDYIIESWVLFAATRKVKELHLIFSGCYPVLPRCVFKCGSLTVLELRNCAIEMPAEFRLNSLKSLSLADISDGWEYATALLAASPNVESLSLIRCGHSYGEKTDQFIVNSSLKNLNLDESECSSRKQTMEVYAPFLIIFDLSVSMHTEKHVFLTRMKSLESVTLLEDDGRGGTVKITDNICHVKDLALSSSNIKAISSIEEKMYGSLSLNCTYLELKTELTNAELAAIVSILKFSPNIRTLIISIGESRMKARIPGEVDKILQKANDFEVDMLKNVETIKVNDFIKNLSLRRPWGKQHCTTEELASQLEDDLSFLKFLLQNSPALKSMTIGLTKPLKLGPIKMMQLQLLIHERLQAFPRGSRDAVVSFRGM